MVGVDETGLDVAGLDVASFDGIKDGSDVVGLDELSFCKIPPVDGIEDGINVIGLEMTGPSDGMGVGFNVLGCSKDGVSVGKLVGAFDEREGIEVGNEEGSVVGSRVGSGIVSHHLHWFSMTLCCASTFVAHHDLPCPTSVQLLYDTPSYLNGNLQGVSYAMSHHLQEPD